MAYPVIGVAKKLIKCADTDRANGGDGLTNMKLQKLLYYQQGYHLAVFDCPLFDDEIEGWMYGPVVPTVYNYYNGYGAQTLPVEPTNLLMSEDEENLFAQVYDAFRDFSAIGLMNKTHQESPWLSLPVHDRGCVITKESMRSFFKSQISND